MAISVRVELNKTRTDGRSTISIRITENKKMRRINTGLSVFKKDFSLSAPYGCWIGKKDFQHAQKNKILMGLLFKAESAQTVLEQRGKPVTLDNIADYLTNNSSQSSFSEYWRKSLTHLEATGKANTYRKSKHCLTKLMTFSKGKEIEFKEITVKFLMDYEQYLQRDGNAVNTINKHLKMIRSILYKGIKEGLFPQEINPFFNFKVKSENTSKSKLNREEVKRIVQADLDQDSTIWHTRNYWRFSLYAAGIRFGDLCKLRWNNINVQDGVLSYKMGKTDRKKTIKLIKPALEILNLYVKGKTDDKSLIFPLLKEEDFKDNFTLVKRISSRNAMVNKNLKKLAKICEVKTPISTHIARHTFADTLLKQGVSIYDLKQALGHASVSTTEIYVSGIDQDSVYEAMLKSFGED